jgi:hypothetical protein
MAKKGRESNCQFDSRPLKVRNRPNLLTYRWHATYHWKYLNKGYNFVLDLTSIGGLKKKLWALKSHESPFREFWDPQHGSLVTKWHLGAGPLARHKEYYKGEGGDFPQVRVVVSLVSPCLHVVHLCTKNVPIMH